MNGNAEQMVAEARSIAERHADILTGDTQAARPVIVTIPADLTSRDLQILVRHEADGVLVDVRADTHSSWTPLCMVGGSFEVRSR